MYGERRAEALPGGNVGGVDSLFLEERSRAFPGVNVGEVEQRRAKVQM